MSLDQLLTKPNNEKKDIIFQCCNCEQFKTKTEDYIKLDEDIKKQSYEQYLVSHGYCKPCFNDLYAKYYNEKNELQDNYKGNSQEQQS